MIERTLNRAHARAVIALARERDEIMQQANAQIKEINAAIDEQAEILRLYFDLPKGKYRFEGDTNGIVLRRVEDKPKEKEAIPPETNPEADPDASMQPSD